MAWPRGASASIGSSIADLLQTAAEFLAATVHAVVGKPIVETTRETRRQRAAAERAESNFAQYLTEHPPPERAIRSAELLSAGNRLWYAADLIAANQHGHNQDAAEVLAATERLEVGYRTLAATIRGHRAAPEIVTDRPDPVGSSSDLAAWLDDLVPASAPTAPEPGADRRTATGTGMPPMSYELTIWNISKGVELAGVGLLIAGGLSSVGNYVWSLARGRGATAYDTLRRTLGRSIWWASRSLWAPTLFVPSPCPPPLRAWASSGS